jgi:predicted AlkP superfamily phosphohydrolase/phosphomutase
VPEILSRLGLGSDEGHATGGVMQRFNNSLKTVVPRGVLPLVLGMARTTPVRRFQRHNGCMVAPLQSPETRAVALPNNQIGAIRLNIQGREPFGRVRPGAEARALLQEIAAEFEPLVLPGGTTPIVDWVRPVEDLFGAEHHPDLPDLLIRFRDDLGVLEACESPRLGCVRVPLNRIYNPRTGDHTDVSRLWLRTPEVRAGARLPEANAIDVAPTVLKMLGVPVPNWMDGRPLPAVA